MNLQRLTAIGILFMLCAAPGIAHHSAAMFDSRKSLTLSGTIKEFQWVNPHCWIQLLVPERNATVEWSIEMGSPSQVYGSGWRPHTLQPGQKVTIVIHPVRDGSRGGQFKSGVAEDGTPLGLKRKGSAP